MSSVFSVPELAIGIAVGGAAGAAFEPKLEIPKQTAWAANPQRLPELDLIAELVAGGKIGIDAGRNMANRLGYSNGTFDSIVWLVQNRLSYPELLRMWRLSAVNPDFDAAGLSALFDKTLAHENLDWDYRPYLRALKLAELPGIGDIAYAVVRGYLPTDIPLPVSPPSTSTNVKRFPQSNTKAETLAAAIGYDQDMLELMIARSGLSMAPGLAAQARFRKILADDDYHLAIAEGDLRTEWANALLETSRAIPSTVDYVEHHLRGWSTQQDMFDGAARHGMTQADTTLQYQIRRRPLTTHQVKQALARGASFNPEPGEITNPYEASVHQANLGPEWYEMAIALQGSYPSLFQMNRLVSSGVINADTAADWMRKAGQADEVVAALHTYWSQLGGGSTDPHVAKAQTQLWTTTHRSYVQGEIDDAAATTSLEAAGVAPSAVPDVLALWREERALVRKQLTPAQIKKAAAEGVPNPATGQPWNLTDAVARLISLGMSANDAKTFMEL